MTSSRSFIASDPTCKVFGLGLSRTGTSSLGGALNSLGIKTIHYPYDAATFDELTRGCYRLSILGDYQAIVDIPAAPYYAQFDRTYPGSKYILTYRDPLEWLRSVETHWRLMMGWWDRFPEFKKFQTFISASVFGSINFNADRFAYVYDLHARNVQQYFAERPEDLLVLNICSGEGWERLCPFLGLPLRTDPFPHLNEWMQQLGNTVEEIVNLIPSGEPFILVDEAQFGNEVPGHAIPFTERDGVYNGPPPDDAAALGELRRLIRSGARFVVFGWPAFWWLDHYAGLAEYLETEFHCLLKNSRLIVYSRVG